MSSDSNRNPRARPTYARFWALVDRTAGPGGCWPWRGPVNRDGVGVFTIRGRRTTARRYAYRTEHGDPGRLRVTVTCRTRACCNLRHLRAVEPWRVATGNGSAADRHSAATHCPAGHPYDRRNTYREPATGRRHCRACRTPSATT